MNLWTAENTVLAILKEVDPLLAERLDQTQLESLVEKEAIQLLEEIQGIQARNRETSVDQAEVLEVAKQTAIEHLKERILAARVSEPES
jgi:hypothetical protein